MTVKLGDGLVVPGDIDPKKLKAAMVKYLDENPVFPLGRISYKGSKHKYKVKLEKDGANATITEITAA